MVLAVNKKQLLIAGLCLVLVASFLIPSLVYQAASLRAQESSTNLRSLLERLNNQTSQNDGFQIAIQFRSPVVPDDETIWVIPDIREDASDEISRAISEIGDDYICFDVVRGGARFNECFPFSNIVSVRYFIE
jgi:hypothetical protein